MYPILSNAIKHLRAALDLREEIVEGRTREACSSSASSLTRLY